MVVALVEAVVRMVVGAVGGATVLEAEVEQGTVIVTVLTAAVATDGVMYVEMAEAGMVEQLLAVEYVSDEAINVVSVKGLYGAEIVSAGDTLL
jgi:hypothetical protein